MDSIEIIGFQRQDGQFERLPLFIMSVSAGIPVPAESDVEKDIDLNEFLIDHPASTFFARIHGNMLNDVGISDGDILIVDTSLEPADSRLVIAQINGELTVKLYRELHGQIYLESHNNQFLPIKIEPYMQFEVLGRVTKIIHSI